jgi:hypothetical protein
MSVIIDVLCSNEGDARIERSSRPLSVSAACSRPTLIAGSEARFNPAVGCDVDGGLRSLPAIVIEEASPRSLSTPES